MTNTKQLRRATWDIAYATKDAYSFYRFSFPAWRGCCQLLLERGYNRLEVECILRSVFMRYAADNSARPYSANKTHLAHFLDHQCGGALRLREYVDDLVLETMMGDDEPTSPYPVPSGQGLHLVWSR